MGKSPKPLTILCHPDIAKWGEVQKLVEQGHTVILMNDVVTETFNNPDLILHPAAWHMTSKHRKYLPLAIAAARKQRYPKET